MGCRGRIGPLHRILDDFLARINILAPLLHLLLVLLPLGQVLFKLLLVGVVCTQTSGKPPVFHKAAIKQKWAWHAKQCAAWQAEYWFS